MRQILVLVSIVGFGCAGFNPQLLKSAGNLGARLVLKEPVDQKCMQAGLKQCPELSDGILLYLDNQPAQAKERLRLVAAANSPEGLRTFAKLVGELGEIPGAAQYLGPVLEAARFLDLPEGHAVAQVRAREASAEPAVYSPTVALARPGAELAGPAPPPEPSGSRMVASMVMPLQNPAAVPCGAGGMTLSCVRVATGPLVLTGIGMVGHCNDRAIALAADPQGDLGAARWAVSVTPAQPNLIGAQFFVGAGEALFIGLESPASVKTDTRCSVSWSGIRHAAAAIQPEPAPVVAREPNGPALRSPAAFNPGAAPPVVNSALGAALANASTTAPLAASTRSLERSPEMIAIAVEKRPAVPHPAAPPRRGASSSPGHCQLNPHPGRTPTGERRASPSHWGAAMRAGP